MFIKLSLDFFGNVSYCHYQKCDLINDYRIGCYVPFFGIIILGVEM